VEIREKFLGTPKNLRDPTPLLTINQVLLKI